LARIVLKRSINKVARTPEIPGFINDLLEKVSASKMPTSAAPGLSRAKLKNIVERTDIPVNRQKTFVPEDEEMEKVNKLIERMAGTEEAGMEDDIAKLRGVKAGKIRVVAFDFSADEDLRSTGLADEAEALSYQDGETTVIAINDKMTYTGERIADSYFNNDRAMRHLIRHEFLETVLDIEHGKIKHLEMLENGKNAMTVLNEILLEHMTEKQLDSVERGHTGDPGDIFYEAAQVKKIAWADRGVLNASKPGEYVNVVVIPLLEDQIFFDGSEYSTLKQKGRRVFSRQYGLNTHVVYCSIDGTEADIGRQLKSEIDDKIAETSEFRDKDKTRIVAFTSPEKFDFVKNELSKYGKKLSGVVKGEFVPDKPSERFDVVSLVILGLGLNEWDRLVSAGQSTDKIARRIKKLLLRMGDYSKNDDVMKTEDVNLMVKGLLQEGFLMRIKKIDYNEMKRYMESQAAVLESL
jgi:hypothetical protein